MLGVPRMLLGRSWASPAALSVRGELQAAFWASAPWDSFWLDVCVLMCINREYLREKQTEMMISLSVLWCFLSYLSGVWQCRCFVPSNCSKEGPLMEGSQWVPLLLFDAPQLPVPFPAGKCPELCETANHLIAGVDLSSFTWLKMSHPVHRESLRMPLFF